MVSPPQRPRKAEQEKATGLDGAPRPTHIPDSSNTLASPALPLLGWDLVGHLTALVTALAGPHSDL